MHPIFKPVTIDTIKIKATDLFLQSNGCVGVVARVTIEGFTSVVIGWWKNRKDGVAEFTLQGEDGLSLRHRAVVFSSVQAMSLEAEFELVKEGV